MLDPNSIRKVDGSRLTPEEYTEVLFSTFSARGAAEAVQSGRAVRMDDNLAREYVAGFIAQQYSCPGVEAN